GAPLDGVGGGWSVCLYHHASIFYNVDFRDLVFRIAGVGIANYNVEVQSLWTVERRAHDGAIDRVPTLDVGIERRISASILHGIQDGCFGLGCRQNEGTGRISRDAFETVIVVAAYRRNLPAVSESVYKRVVMDLVVGVDNLQHGDDLSYPRVPIVPVIILLRTRMVETGNHWTLPIWRGSREPFVQIRQVDSRS